MSLRRIQTEFFLEKLSNIIDQNKTYRLGKKCEKKIKRTGSSIWGTRVEIIESIRNLCTMGKAMQLPKFDLTP